MATDTIAENARQKPQNAIYGHILRNANADKIAGRKSHKTPHDAPRRNERHERRRAYSNERTSGSERAARDTRTQARSRPAHRRKPCRSPHIPRPGTGEQAKASKPKRAGGRGSGEKEKECPSPSMRWDDEMMKGAGDEPVG